MRSEVRDCTTPLVRWYQAKLYMRYVLKQIQSKFLDFSLFLFFGFLHIKKFKKVRLKQPNNAYKEMHDA